MLADVALRMDIFLSADGRSLAGWNSHPLACSAFAAITRSHTQTHCKEAPFLSCSITIWLIWQTNTWS